MPQLLCIMTPTIIIRLRQFILIPSIMLLDQFMTPILIPSITHFLPTILLFQNITLWYMSLMVATHLTTTLW